MVTVVDNDGSLLRPDRISVEIRNSANVVVYSSNGVNAVHLAYERV